MSGRNRAEAGSHSGALVAQCVRMNLEKLFQVLVVGGALLANGAGCSGDDTPVDANEPMVPDAPGDDAANPTPDAADTQPDAAQAGDYCGCAGQPGDCACGATPCCWLVYAPCCDECPG